jgi:hypothetical protein
MVAGPRLGITGGFAFSSSPWGRKLFLLCWATASGSSAHPVQNHARRINKPRLKVYEKIARSNITRKREARNPCRTSQDRPVRDYRRLCLFLHTPPSSSAAQKGIVGVFEPGSAKQEKLSSPRTACQERGTPRSYTRSVGRAASFSFVSAELGLPRPAN